jgi:hypothetical protein
MKFVVKDEFKTKMSTYVNLLKTAGALNLTGLSVGFCVYATKSKPKINLILDLDETLIHSKPLPQNFKIFRKPDFTVRDGENGDCGVWKRPYSGVMFTVLQPFCDFHLYTSADKEYASEIITRAGWNKHFLRGVSKYYDDDYKKNGCKDINALDIAEPAVFNKTKTVLVDDCEFNDCQCSKYFYRFHHISPYELYNSTDTELLKLTCRVIYDFFTQE